MTIKNRFVVPKEFWGKILITVGLPALWLDTKLGLSLLTMGILLTLDSTPRSKEGAKDTNVESVASSRERR